MHECRLSRFIVIVRLLLLMARCVLKSLKTPENKINLCEIVCVKPYRVMSSLHSSAALGLVGTGRKRVFLSAEGWSRLRTQQSSPDLDHWPKKPTEGQVRLLLSLQEALRKQSDAEREYLTFT